MISEERHPILRTTSSTMLGTFCRIALVTSTIGFGLGTAHAQEGSEAAPETTPEVAPEAAPEAAPEVAPEVAPAMDEVVSTVDDVRLDARKAMKSSQWEQAVADWKRVLAVTPDDAEAKKGLAQAQAALDQASTIDSVQSDLAVQRQRAIVEYNAEMARANQLLESGSYESAQRTALTAKVRLERSRSILPSPAYNSMIRDAEALLVRISDVKINAQLVQQSLEREQARSAANEQQRIEAADRQRQIRENIIRVRELQMELKYEEALQVLEQILFMDPLNPAALASGRDQNQHDVHGDHRPQSSEELRGR